VVGPLLGGWIAHALGFPAAFLAQGAFNVVGILLIQCAMPNTPKAADAGGGGEPSRRQKGGAATWDGGTRVASIASICAEFWPRFLTTGTFTFMLSFLRAARDLIVPLAGARLVPALSLSLSLCLFLCFLDWVAITWLRITYGLGDCRLAPK
jgi:hypothetical protein